MMVARTLEVEKKKLEAAVEQSELLEKSILEKASAWMEWTICWAATTTPKFSAAGDFSSDFST